jgi:hypothetical protein
MCGETYPRTQIDVRKNTIIAIIDCLCHFRIRGNGSSFDSGVRPKTPGRI